MKQLLSLLFLLSSANSFAALNLVCSSDTGAMEWDVYRIGYKGNTDTNVQLVIPNFVTANCRSAKGEDYTLQIKAGGVGAHFTFHERLVVTCPLVSEKKLMKRGHMILVGVNASVSLGLGVDVGLYAGRSVCALVGVEFGVGAGVSIGAFAITHSSSPNSDGVLDLPF